MNISPFLEALQSAFGAHLPALLGALGIGLGGWLLAMLVQRLVARGLAQVRLNERLANSLGSPMSLERPVALAGFWLIVLVTAVSVFNVLDLLSLSTPFAHLLQIIIGYAPHLLAGVVLSLTAWLLASLSRALVFKALSATRLDAQWATPARTTPLSRSASELVFWLVLLLLLPSVLGAFQLTGTLGPVQDMLQQAFGLLPKLAAAAAIALVGWWVARVARGLTTNLLATAGLDKWVSPQAANSSDTPNSATANGVHGSQEANAATHLPPPQGLQASKLAGTVVYFLVLIPALIAALDALSIAAISAPASMMLSQLLNALPHVLAAALILTLSWFIAQFASSLVAQLLHSAGVDALPAKLGMASFSAAAAPSQLARWAVVVFAMFFAIVEAANQLGFEQVSQLMGRLITFGGDIALGALILSVGFWLANLASAAIARTSGESGGVLAGVAKFAILGLVLAMGLRAMGIANEIVALAFGLTLGSVAVAAALAFGLGGRATAGKVLNVWFERWRGPR